MSYFSSVVVQEPFALSPDFQFNPTSSFMEGQLYVDNSCVHDNPSLSSPGDHFDILKSAALFAGILQDQSDYPVREDIDREGKSEHSEVNLFGDDGQCSNGSGLSGKGHDLGSDPGFDGDVEYDVNESDDDDDEDFFSPRPADTCTHIDEVNDSCREPPAKRRRLFSPEQVTKRSTSELANKKSHDKQDNQDFALKPGNKRSLLDEDLYLSESEDDSKSTDADSSFDSSNEWSSDESSDSDTSDSDSSFDDSDPVSDDDSDISDISTDSESESNVEGYSYERLDESDDTSDDVECDVSCVCQSGSYFPLKPMKRKLRVSVPLYTKLLKHRMMKTAHRYAFECCDSLCSFRWRVKRREHVYQDYAQSDLRVEYYKWGKWKADDPEDDSDDSDSDSDD